MKPFASRSRRDGKAWVKLAIGIALMLGAIYLLLPSVSTPRWVHRRMSSQNNLKQIGLAMHNYYDTYGELPPAVVTGEDGTPLYSWRVLLLPYLEEKELYEQFDLQQPWSSEHNRALLDKMPSVYESPCSPDTPEVKGQTPYRAIVDSDAGRTVLKSTAGGSFREVTDGTSNSAMVIDDPARLVQWTKPEDIDALELLALTPIDENEIRCINVLLADASVRTIDEERRSELVPMVFCNDGRMTWGQP